LFSRLTPQPGDAAAREINHHPTLSAKTQKSRKKSFHLLFYKKP
jgi:hypothetical protein